MTGIYMQPENVFCEIKTEWSAVTGIREEWIPRHSTVPYVNGFGCRTFGIEIEKTT